MSTQNSGLSFTDRFLSYETFKVLRVQDRRLGAMYRTFQFSILLYIVSTVVIQQRYLSTENIISGAVRISLRTPQGGVQTRSYCQPPEHPCLYWDANDILYDPNIDGALITTRAHVRQIGPWPPNSQSSPTDSVQQCDVNVPTMSVCDPDQAPVTILTPASYVADIEEFTLMLEHSIRGQASGVEIRSGNMEYGELIDSATGLAVKRWDDQIRALTSPTWYNKNDVSLMATAAGAVGSSSFQQWDPSASVLDAKLPWKSRPHKIAGDVMRVGDLLRAADIQLDTISESPMATRNETIRSAGVVIIVVIQYGAVGWNPNKISYRYMPKAIPDQEYKAVETIRDFQAGRRVEINRHGIKIVISQHGQLGKFSLMTLLTNLVAAVALFKVANILVELMMLRLHPQKVVYGQAKYDSTRGRVGGGGGGMGPVSGGHVKESFKDKDNSLADLQDSEDKPDYYDHRCSMTGDRTLRALGTHHAQHHSQTQQQDFTGARSAVQNQRISTRKEQAQRSFTILTGISPSELNTDHKKHLSGIHLSSSPSFDAHSPNSPSLSAAITATSAAANTSTHDTEGTITTATFPTSNSSHLTQLGSLRRPVSSAVLNRATTSSHDLITTSAHLRERTPRRGGEEEDDIIETRYGAISLSEIRSPGCVTRGFNPGRLVVSPTPPPKSPSIAATRTDSVATKSVTIVETEGSGQHHATVALATPSSKTPSSDKKVDASHDPATSYSVQETPLMNVTGTSAKITPGPSSSSSIPPRSPADMAGTSPLPVCFGFSRHSSLDNLRDSSFSSPVSTQSPTLSSSSSTSSLSGTPSPTIAADSIASSNTSNGGRRTPRPSRILGTMRRSNSARNLNQRSSSSPSLLGSLGSTTPVSSGQSTSSLLHHRASLDTLSTSLPRPNMESPSLRPTLPSASRAASPSLTPTTLLANIGSTSVVTETQSTSTLVSHSSITSSFNALATMDGSQGGSHFGASSHQQQQIRTSAFKKLKKDTGSTSGHFGTDEYLLTIASPQALSARRVSSGSLFGSSSTSTSTAGRTFPFSSAFTFRSASADPLTDRKKKNSGGTRFVAEPSSFYGNGSAADAKGKSVAFDHSFNHGSNKMAGGIEWLSFYTDDSTNRPCLTSRGFGTATSSSLSSSTSSLHTESLGSGSDNLSSTPWSVFHYSQPPVYPTKSHIGVHPFDLDAWTRESKSRASSPLVGPYSTRPSPRLSVGPSPTPSPVSTSSSRPEGSRTLRTSTSMPLLFQSAAAVGSSSKLRNNSLVPSGSPSLLSSCSTVATNTTRDAQCEMQEKQLKDGTEDGEDEEEDEDEEELMASSAGSAVEKSGSTSSDRLSDPTNQQHDYPPSSSTATTQPSEQLQRNDSQPQSTSTHQSAASAFARPLPPLPPSTTTTATTSMITTTSHPRLSSGSSTVTHTISFALPPHPLLGSSYTTASRSMPSLVTKFRNGDERSAFSPTAAATTSAATTVMTMSTDLSTPSAGQSSTWTKTAHGLPSGGSSSSSSIHSHTDSHRDSGSSYNTSSAQSMLLQQQSKSQQQQQPQLRSPESPAASSVSSSPTYSTCTSFSQPSLSPPSSSSPPDSSSLSTGLLTSRSASNLHGATSTTAAVLPVPPPSFITPTTTKTMPPLSQSASAHMQHFQAQILKHQQKQLQQKQQQQQQQEQGQGQQQSPSQHQGIHGSHPLKRSESVVAPAASLFFSSPITMASTHVPPGSGVRMLSRTITMTTAENRKLVLCRSESLQLCEGVGEEKAARI